MVKAKIKQYISAEKLLRVAEVPVEEVACRSAGISLTTLYRWRKKIAKLSFDAPILSRIDRKGKDPMYIKIFCQKCNGNIAKVPLTFDGDREIYNEYDMRCMYCGRKTHRGFWARLLGW